MDKNETNRWLTAHPCAHDLFVKYASRKNTLNARQDSKYRQVSTSLYHLLFETIILSFQPARFVASCFRNRTRQEPLAMSGVGWRRPAE